MTPWRRKISFKQKIKKCLYYLLPPPSSSLGRKEICGAIYIAYKYEGNKIWSYYHSPFSSDLHTEPENRYIVLGCIFMTIQLELPVWPSLKIILSLHNPCVIVFGTKPWSFPFSWKSIFPLSFVFSVTETVTRPLHYFCQPAQLTQYTKQSES